MPDVQLAHPRQGRHRADVGHGQAVPGVRFPASSQASFRGGPDLRELRRRLGARGSRVGVRVQLEAGHVVLVVQRRDLVEVRIDEDGDPDARRDEAAGRAPHLVAATDQVEAALGRDLVRPFRHQCDLIGYDPLGELDHRFVGRDLEVEPAADDPPQTGDVLVLDVTAVLAQMHRDAERARFLGEARRLDRIRIPHQTRLPHSGDVVDVHRQRGHASSSSSSPRSR